MGPGTTDLVLSFMGDGLNTLVGWPEAPPGIGVLPALNRAAQKQLHFLALNGMPTDAACLDLDSNQGLDVAALRYRDEGLTAGITLLSTGQGGALNLVGEILLGSDDVLAFDTRSPEVMTAVDLNMDKISLRPMPEATK